MRKPAELIHRQDPISINQALLAKVSPDDVHVIVSLPKQRAYLMTGEQVIIDSPISSGKRGHESPHGKFSVMEKDQNHHSSLYGDFRDSKGRIVRAGVSARIDSAPSGTHFTGAEMKWFMRLTGEGVGMHVGILPGYPASHGCIRMPSQAARALLRARQSRHARRSAALVACEQLFAQKVQRRLGCHLFEGLAIAREIEMPNEYRSAIRGQRDVDGADRFFG